MHKSIFLAVLFCLLFGGAANAAEVTVKIGVFSSQALAQQCQPLIDARSKLEAQFANEGSGLEQANSELQKQAADLQAKQSVLAPEAWEEQRLKFQRQQRDFEDRYQAFARKVQAAQARLQNEFGNNLMQAAREYGTANGYGLLLDADMGGPIFYTNDVNVTEGILAALNKAYSANRPSN